MATATSALYLDDLDLSRCVIGVDAILDRSTNTLYASSHAGELSLIGTFDSPGAAMSALDLLAD